MGTLDAVGTASEARTDSAPMTTEKRIAEIFEELRRVGPGEHLSFLFALRQYDRAAVLEKLRAEFPGLLWFHRHVSHRCLPRGRDTGPLPALLVELGEQALGVILAFLDGGQADQRYYTALVVADLADEIGPQARATLIPTLEARLFDPDTQVRDVAVHALRSLERTGSLDDTGLRLVERAQDVQLNVGVRLMALRGLGALRSVPAIPALIDLLRDSRPEVRRGARLALRSIAVTDRGDWRWRWRLWAHKHLAAGRHRWLLAGLLDRDPALRRLAHGDLVRLTGHDLPFDPDGPAAERQRVHHEFSMRLMVMTAGQGETG